MGGGVIYRDKLEVDPQAEQEVRFLRNLSLGGGDLGGWE